MALDSDAPFPFYADRYGAPMQDGSVYFGTSGQNPVTSPITVYWDEAGTQPAAQPISISSGMTTRNGTPARVWIDGDYSRLALDSKGRQVVYEATPPSNLRKILAAPTGAGLMGWIRSAVGAVARWVADKLAERISVADFIGFVGDGANDDTAAVQRAVNHAATLGHRTKITAPPGSTIKLVPVGAVTPLGVVTHYCVLLKSGVEIDFRGSEVIYTQNTGGDTVSVLTNAANPISNFAVKNVKFRNTGTGDPSGSEILIYGGTNATTADYATDFSIENCESDGGGIMCMLEQDRTDSVRPIRRFSIKGLRHVNSKNCTVYGYGVERFNVSDIVTDGSAFDCVMLFSASHFNVDNIVGNNITENVIGLEARNYSDVIEDGNISNVEGGTSGKIGVNTVNAGNAVQDIHFSNVAAATVELDNTGLGTVRRLSGNLSAKAATPGRGAMFHSISDSDLSATVTLTGNPTVEGVAVVAVTDVHLDLNVQATASTKNSVRVTACTGLHGDWSVEGGTNGVYIASTGGAVGPTTKSHIRLQAKGQSVGAVGYDGNDNVGHFFTIEGEYSNQALSFSNHIGDKGIIKLTAGQGADLTISGGVLAAVTHAQHVIQSESGVTDNLDSIGAGLKGQVVTLLPKDGHTITVISAGTGNIFPKGAVNAVCNGITPITLQYRGDFWLEL